MKDLPALAASCPNTGLTLPLTKSLASPDLAKHRAMIALELEVMAKKMDRFGWERDRGTAAHDRIVTDWMQALQGYPLDEVQEACRMHVAEFPRKMPNEGDVLFQLRQIRKEKAARFKAALPPRQEPEPRERITAARATEILQDAGFAPKRMGEAE